MHEAHPLLIQGQPAQVDGSSVCAGCGLPVDPLDGWTWCHREPGAPPAASPWFTPVTPQSLARTDSYEEFGQRFPWAVTPFPGGATVTSAADWAEARRRLQEYGLLLDRLRLRRSPAAEDYLDVVRTLAGDTAGGPQLMTWQLTPGVAQVVRPLQRRRELSARLAWAIPTEGAVQLLVGAGPLVEAGAGRGLWAALVNDAGGDVAAYDIAPPDLGGNTFHPRSRRTWTTVELGSAVDAVRRNRDRALFLCWPPFDDDAASHAALLAYRGDVLYYAGDGQVGATGSARFRRELDLNWTCTSRLPLPGWPRIDDCLSVYRRRTGPRARPVPDKCPVCGRFAAPGSIGRCASCRERRPAALALRRGPHVLEYSTADLQGLPPMLVRALELSPNREYSGRQPVPASVPLPQPPA